MAAENIWVEHSTGRYPIVFDQTEGFDAAVLVDTIGDRRPFIVTNETVSPLYLADLLDALKGYTPDVCTLLDGEKYKTVDAWTAVLNDLAAGGHHRDTVVLALGGGVVGDIAGFAAACYQRGVACIQLPTTLLSQVDSSVGGKTGINHPLGKNLIGAFWQPELVLINPRTLKSLPQREYHSGFAEIIKAAMLVDSGLFEQLEESSTALLARDETHLCAVIHSACRIKKELVEADERETTGVRALLNLGHTFAHAIEQYFGFGVWLHGEAVGLGLVLATGFAAEVGLCTKELYSRVEHLVYLYGLPTYLPRDTNCATLCSVMALDKKSKSGQLRMVLPKRIGCCELTIDYQIDAVREYLESGSTSG